jgi:hypothetical protein
MESYFTSKKLRADNGVEVEISFDGDGKVRGFVYRENDGEGWQSADLPELFFQAIEMAKKDFAVPNVCADHGITESAVCNICLTYHGLGEV